MDLQSTALSYVFLVIPMMFAMVVIIQGLSKIANKESDGQAAVGFGVVLLLLVGATYFFVLR